ncbi:hypothetical protein [Bacillus sp. T33-2]|uniref:hypothetical protein n=1 Tax=Bacillus sp. T33-2 TaxID=2054168 RepID=UPI000C77811B|nr:hypothetical protein [Bacillus sp. T33-2]PLR99560.1 hypothetical protein CVD19_00420 [Bacillus sp. T33-2]
MEQRIIAIRPDYSDEEGNSRLQFNYLNTHFSEYETWRDYLHIQMNGYDGFNLYIEMSERQIDDLINLLQSKKKYLR